MTVPGRSDFPDVSRKPRDDELDVWGLTHPGRARRVNQDNFLLASVHKRVEVHLTSLTDLGALPTGEERLAYFRMVADGVGGGEAGEEASRFALRAAIQYAVGSMHCYYQQDAQEVTFVEALQEAAMRTHESVQARAAENPDVRSMATTLTLWMGVWPWIYVLQVGDSRYYVYRDGELTQVTRDQTMAEALRDQGVKVASEAFSSKWGNMLASSIGGSQTAPVVTRIPSDWRNVHLLCSDGLTKHVSDERIRERLAAMTSAKQVCEELLRDALEGGGSDNVTIVVGRTVPDWGRGT